MTVVIATRNRRDELLQTLERLAPLTTGVAEIAEVVVVDNGSSDGTALEVARCFPSVGVLPLPCNAGAAARNAGVRHARTPLVAFSDDDSWWAPGMLRRAGELFARAPRLGLVAARVVVEPAGFTDPTCALMAQSPLTAAIEGPGGPYRAVLGFLACGAVVRCEAFLAAGGFRAELMVGGEEELLSIDLAVGGWERIYAPEVVAHHRPSLLRDGSARRRVEVRNALWTAWARRPLPAAARRTGALLAEAARSGDGVRGAWDACCGWSWARANRAVVPAWIERDLAALEAAR